MFKAIEKNIIVESNTKFTDNLNRDYEYFLERISRLNINENLLKKKNI